MKIMIMTDSPFIPSGMGRVGRELAVGLAARGHEVGYLGWWHRADITPNLPHNIQFWWTNNSQYGADIFDQIVMKFQPEIVITIGDFWFLWYIDDPHACKTRKTFQWCSYIPVDGEPMCGGLPPDVIPSIEGIDLPVAYTDYARKAVMKSVRDQETRNRIEVIYHGVDTKTFKPIDPAERRKIREQYGINEKFVFLTVSRNQTRKNIPDLFRAWKIFSEMPDVKGNASLWPHMYFSDSAGWQIDNLMHVLGLNNSSIIYFENVAHGRSEMHLLPDEELAKLYQVADAFILISGEGFGLPIFEAMATRLPCILLNHSAPAELGADGRAHLVNWKESWTGLHLTQRPVVDPEDIAAAMLKVFKDKQYRDSIASKGYEFVQDFTWEKVLEKWHMLLLRQEVPFIKPIKMEVVA
jgi:glycosyltransferase involved in cell wall biosynthesis